MEGEEEGDGEAGRNDVCGGRGERNDVRESIKGKGMRNWAGRGMGEGVERGVASRSTFFL